MTLPRPRQPAVVSPAPAPGPPGSQPGRLGTPSPRLAVGLAALIWLVPATAWAGPYTQDAFGMLGLLVFFFGLPLCLGILSISKAVFWCRLPHQPGVDLATGWRIGGAILVSLVEIVVAVHVLWGFAAVAYAVPTVSHQLRTNGWVALPAWFAFFGGLAALDVAHNRWLLRRAAQRHPGLEVPLWHTSWGAMVIGGLLATWFLLAVFDIHR
ncbi:MAG: hypothetical protein GX442_18830 [Candidatus Riflebacteria bacterium]|nr:hypothetical protein [Candidatus Riflebacteria bacterium]